MNTVKVIIEYDGAVVLNSEYHAQVSATQPLSLMWFRANDLVIDTGGEKMIFNTEDFGDCVTAVGADTFIIRPHRKHKNNEDADITKATENKKAEDSLVITASEAHTIFNEKLTLEIAEGGTQNFFTIKMSNGKKYAYPMPQDFHVVKNSTNNSVNTSHEDITTLPTIFIKYVENGDFKNAQRLIAFDISEENLKRFFTAHPPAIENFDFEIKNGLIQNISPKAR